MSSVADMDILLEAEADKRREVEEKWIARYIATVKQRRSEAEAAREEQERIRTAESQQSARDQLVITLERNLRLSVPVDRVRIEIVGEFGEWYPAVDFGGVTFALRNMNSRSGVSYKVHVARPCVNCGGTVWSDVTYPDDLVYELEREHEHDYECRQKFDEDGEPTTDRFGNPRYEITETVITYQPTPAERYTAAIKRRRDLQFERAKVKELAVRRIITNKGVTFNGESFVAGSATAAEKLVEFDEGYAAHCAALTDAVIEEIAAREALRAAGGNPQREDEET